MELVISKLSYLNDKNKKIDTIIRFDNLRNKEKLIHLFKKNIINLY